MTAPNADALVIILLVVTFAAIVAAASALSAQLRGMKSEADRRHDVLVVEARDVRSTFDAQCPEHPKGFSSNPCTTTPPNHL